MTRPTCRIAFLCLLLGSSRAFPDGMTFARGAESLVPAEGDDQPTRVDVPAGPRPLPIEKFPAESPGHDPGSGWFRVRDRAIREGSATSRFGAFWWALENGLTREAVSLLREGRAFAPDHPPTRRALAAFDALAPPCPDPDLGPIRRSLGGERFAAIRSEHVLLLHQGDEAEALDRLDLLERVVQTFHLALAAQGVAVSPPRHRLVSVWFARRPDYVGFLRRSEAGAFAETQGYYHPILGVVLAFDTRSGEAQLAGRRALANLARDGAAKPDLDRRLLLLDLEWRATDLGIGAHETIHQLTEDSGLAARFDDFPLWLHEGFAAQFEVVREGRWAGFGRVHDRRLPDFRAIHPSPRLAPLLRDAGFGHGYRRDVYAESWALVYFLRKTRSREFLTYLDLLRSSSPGIEGRSIDHFRSAFGDELGPLEAEWREYLANLRTPSESEHPKSLESSKTRLVPTRDGP